MNYLKALGAGELSQHIEQTQFLWGGLESRSDRLAGLNQRLEFASPDTFFLSGLVEDSGHLMASLKRYYFQLAVRGQTVNCVGLGAVFTDPRSRRNGYAASLIQTVLAEARSEQGCGVALLYSDIGIPYYQKLGFKEAPAFRWTMAAAELPGGECLDLRPAGEGDLHKLIDLYQSHMAPVPLYTKRTVKTWRLFRDINRVQYDFILSHKGRELGFFSFSINKEQGYLWLDEYSAPQELAQIMAATIRKAAQDHGCKEIRSWSLPLFRPPGAKLTPRTQALPMVSLLDPKTVIKPDDLRKAYFSSADHF